MLTPQGTIIKGYKATDKDMKCRGFQFELGVWHEHDGELSLCSSGFHFCQYPSGPWSYYAAGRLFEVEAECVLLSEGPGADLKHVAKRIRLVREIKIDGDLNTGNRNTGDWNTGNRNTGDMNTGDGNTGHRNTGHRNTGDRNTGDRNTGHRNTGDWNTGDWNTGDGNTGDFHSGSLCCGAAPFYLFDKRASRENANFYLINKLARLLALDDEIDPTPFLTIQHATPQAIKKLHEAHKKARAKQLRRES